MLERAFKLKDALELYQQHFKEAKEDPIDEDVLTPDDWLELRELLDILLPLKAVSKCLESDGRDCCHGSLWESLTAIDFLLTKLERLKQQYNHLPNSHLRASINLGWKKLDKYYSLSDQTPAYRAAIAIHPAKKMRWFELKWSESHPQWISEARAAITSLYNEYKQRHIDEAIQPSLPNKELTEFERYNLLDDEHELDDLERFLREERAPSSTNPLVWWQANHDRFPVLRYMAFDLLGAPATSSADERAFSMAGEVLSKDRFNTRDDFAEAAQCLKSWIHEGLIYKLPNKSNRKSKNSSSSKNGTSSASTSDSSQASLAPL
jgi:hypothetical protein